MKKAILATIGACITAMALMACGGAYAADANLVKGTDGVSSHGIILMTSVDKDTSSGSNRVAVTFLGETAATPIADDAGWSKYNHIKTQLIGAGAMQVGTSDRYIVVTRAKTIDCQSNNSRVWFPVTGNALQVIGDGCAFRDKVNANSF